MAGGGHKDLGKVRRAKIWEEKCLEARRAVQLLLKLELWGV